MKRWWRKKAGGCAARCMEEYVAILVVQSSNDDAKTSPFGKGRPRKGFGVCLSVERRTDHALNVKALTAAAFVLFLRVVELKAFVQTFADKIELGAINVDKTLGVNKHFYAM